MPKDKRRRATHAPSVKLSSRHFALPDSAVEQLPSLQSSCVPAVDLLQHLSREDTQKTKKVKRQRKHEEFMRRFQNTGSPYSRSHTRRLKDKSKQNFITSLGDMVSALQTINTQATNTGNAAPLAMHGQSTHLTNKQRARVLETEKFRHSMVILSPEYQKTPFLAIRNHIQAASQTEART